MCTSAPCHARKKICLDGWLGCDGFPDYYDENYVAHLTLFLLLNSIPFPVLRLYPEIKLGTVPASRTNLKLYPGPVAHPGINVHLAVLLTWPVCFFSETWVSRITLT